jgi:hypothetical protein
MKFFYDILYNILHEIFIIPVQHRFCLEQQDFLYVGVQKSGIYAAFKWSNLLPIGSQKASYNDAASTTNKKDTDIPIDSLSRSR